MKIRYSIFLVLTLVFIVTVRRVSAHAMDHDLVLDAVRVGPYYVTVWTISTVQQEVDVHVSAAIAEPGSGTPVMAADVTFRFDQLSGDSASFTSVASPALPTNGFLHESNLRLPEPGRYRVTVSVSDLDGQGGEVEYYIVAYPVSIWTKGFVIGLMFTGIIGMAWLLYEGRSVWLKRS